MLEAENKKMEDKLKVVQGLIDNERQKRSSQGMRGSPATGGAAAASGKMWRSSNQSSNYAKQVLEQHKKALATGVRPPI